MHLRGQDSRRGAPADARADDGRADDAGGADSAGLFGWLLRATADPMAVFRVRDGRVVDCNDAFLRLTGYARGELVDRAGADLGLEGLSRRDRDVVAPGAGGPVTTRIRTRSGAVHEVRSTARTVTLAGEPCVVSVVHDGTAHREAEETRALFDAVFASAPIGIAVMDTDLRYVRVNETLAAINGCSADEHVGRTIAEVVPELAGTLEPALRAVLDRREPIVAREVTGIRPSTGGRAGHWLASYYPLVSAAGELVGLGAIVTDVGGRRRAEDALRASEAHKRAILEAALDCVITMDEHGLVTEWNPASERTFGRRHEDTVGRPLADLIVPPKLRAQHWAGVRRQLETGEGRLLGRRVEITGMRADGAEFPVELSINRIDVDGRPVFTGYLRDITERQRADDERRHAIRELASVIDTAPVAIIERAVDGGVRRWNPAAERLLGWTRDEALAGAPLVVPDDRRAEWDELRERVESGEVVTDFETVRRRKDGSLVDVNISLAPVYDAHGAVTATIGVLADLSSRKRSERRLALQYDATHVLAQAETVEAAAPAVLGAIARALGCQWAGYWQFQASVRALTLESSWHDDALGRYAERSRHETFPPGVGVPGRVFARAEMEWVTDVAPEELGFLRREEAVESGIRSAVCVPIHAAGAPTGALELGAEDVRPFDADDAALLQAIADQFGQFVEQKATQEHLADSEAHRQLILAEMLRAEQSERARIATDLHDDTIQVMAALLVTLDRVARLAEDGDVGRVRDATQQARGILAEATERTRQLMFRMRPPLLEAGGLEPAVRDLLAEAAKTAGFRAELRAEVDRYPWAVEELAYRAVQEAVTNATKHSGANRLAVTLCDRGDALEGTVEDDGSGFDVAAAHDRSRMRLHLGFDAIRERIRLAGGELAVDSSPGRGTRVTFRVPVGAVDAGEYIGRREATAMRRQADEWLAVLDTLLATAPVGFAFWDRNMRYVRINQALAEMDGLPVEDHIGRTLAEVLPDMAPVLEPLSRRVIETGESVVGLELEGETPAAEGERRNWLASYYPVRHGSGDVIGIGAVVVDTTERKRAEEERARLLVQAEGTRAEAERARRGAEEAQREAERVSQRLAFLAEVGQALASSLDYRRTLARVAELAVPRVADWCAIDLVDESGVTHPVKTTHVDPAKVKLAEELARRYPPPPDAPHGAPNVIRTGRPEIYPEITDDLLVAAARDPEHLEIVRGVGMTSAMVVPLTSRGRTLGAITFVAAESGHHYTQDDLAFASQLARRAAVAIDNALLFEERAHASRALQRALLPRALPDIPGVEVAAGDRPAPERAAGAGFHDVIATDRGTHVLAVGGAAGTRTEAAAATILARHTLRTAARYEPSPARILAALDRALREADADAAGEGAGPPRVTAVCAEVVAARGGARLLLTSAGCSAPLVVRRDGGVEVLATADEALGGPGGSDGREIEVELAPGDAIVLAGGAVESAGGGQGDGAADAVRRALAGAGGRSAREIAAAVADELRRGAGDGSPVSQAAVLAVRALPADG
jgi:PAS domain S-box-containing protein